MTAGQISLSVNDTPIALNDFIQGYIDHVMGGILSSLKGTEGIKSVELTIEGDQVSIILNNVAVTLNPFAARIIRNTMMGIISTLHGVHAIERLQLNIQK